MPGHAIRCWNWTQLLAPPERCLFYVSIFASSTSTRNRSEESETVWNREKMQIDNSMCGGRLFNTLWMKR